MKRQYGTYSKLINVNHSGCGCTVINGETQQSKSRERGSIERHGSSLRVKVYAGIDPLTGKRIYLTESAPDEREAEKILCRLQSQVDGDRATKTKATLRTAIAEWLPKHDVEESTRKSYQLYFDTFVLPALGDEPVVRIGPKLLEDLYAELRRCRTRCDGKPFVEHRTEEQPTAGSSSTSGGPAARRWTVTRSTTAKRLVARSPSARRISAIR